jgi:hypothetical protein
MSAFTPSKNKAVSDTGAGEPDAVEPTGVPVPLGAPPRRADGPTAGTIRPDTYARELLADNADRAAVSAKYAGKRWLVHLCDNLQVQEDRVDISIPFGAASATIRIRFRDRKELEGLERVGSKKRIRVNALSCDAFEFTDAFVVPWTDEERKEQARADKLNALKVKVAEAEQQLTECNSRIARYSAPGAVVENGSQLKAEQVALGLDAAKVDKAALEEELRALKEEIKKVEAK